MFLYNLLTVQITQIWAFEFMYICYNQACRGSQDMETVRSETTYAPEDKNVANGKVDT